MLGNGRLITPADDHPDLRALASLIHEAGVQLALAAFVLFALSWTFFDEGLGLLALPGAALLGTSWKVSADVRRESPVTRLLTPPPLAFSPFWHGGRTSRLSQLVYNRFLSSFGPAAHGLDKETVEKVLDETCKAATGTRLSLECPVDEGNWRTVARYLEGNGVQANLETVAAGVPIEDVFA